MRGVVKINGRWRGTKALEGQDISCDGCVFKDPGGLCGLGGAESLRYLGCTSSDPWIMYTELDPLYEALLESEEASI